MLTEKQQKEFLYKNRLIDEAVELLATRIIDIAFNPKAPEKWKRVNLKGWVDDTCYNLRKKVGELTKIDL